jgi:hypothetical protein
MAAKTKDVVVLVPGLLGSVLEKNGKPLWGLSGGALLRALFSMGGSIKSLTLKSDSEGDVAADGVVARAVLPDTHLLPGFWKVDGYTRVANTLVERLGLTRGKNFFEFPYDWRRDNRYTAKRFARQTEQWLHAWRTQHGGPADARLVLVAHSMGGIVSRYFLECLEGWKNTRALITFGTPYRGSLMALQALSLGFRKNLGPVNLIDLSDMVRSFPSAYQLLPIYPCVARADGSVVRPGEARDIPHLDPERAAAGLAFQREIERAVESNLRSEAYATQGYAIHPVVGTYQPTLQGARLTGAGLEMLSTQADGKTDHAGDGTVPRVSAMPLEERHHARALYNATSHASLQNALEVLAHVEGVLTGHNINLGDYRVPDRKALGGPLQLSLHLQDAYAHDEPFSFHVTAAQAPKTPLRATVTHVDSGQDFPVALKRGRDTQYEAREAPLQPGLYRLSVEGGPEVVPVSDVFAVFPRTEDELPVGGGPGGHSRAPASSALLVRSSAPSPGGAPPQGVSPSAPMASFSAPEEEVPVQASRPLPGPSAGSQPSPFESMHSAKLSVPPVKDEEQTLTRHPLVEPLWAARPGQPLALRVDLLLEQAEGVAGAPVVLSGLEPGWKQLPIDVRVVCAGMSFRPGEDEGVVLVQRNKASRAATLTGTVRPEASGELLVVVTFEYAGRFCGAAQRRIPIEPAGSTGSSGPGASSGSSSSSPTGSGSEASEAMGTFALEADAPRPYMTVQIHRPDRNDPRRLLWVLQVPVECEGLPSRLSEEMHLGTNPAEFFLGVASTARELRPGDHYNWFLGLGQLLYENTPRVFREALHALRKVYKKGFPIQFITDDPHIPWELMATGLSSDDEVELLCVEHPVARWLLDYQTSMTSRLPEGALLTVAPDYSFHRSLSPLPAAQEEARLLASRFHAERVPGKRQDLMSVLQGGHPRPVSLLHFAGHGEYSGNPVKPSVIHLEDNEVLHTLEVRNSRASLGRRTRPLVLFNACEVGGATDVLGGMAGWAEAFVRGRFGGFLAPLWPVQDEHALRVVEGLVEDLVEKHLTVGEALLAMRKREARVSPTYLAYIYVGDVMARIGPTVASARTPTEARRSAVG